MADTTEEKVDLRNETVTIIGDRFVVSMSARCVTTVADRDARGCTCRET